VHLPNTLGKIMGTFWKKYFSQHFLMIVFQRTLYCGTNLLQ